MATTIITKNGSGAPLAGDLTAGELAVDLTNKRLYSKDSGGTVIELGTNAGSSTFADLTVSGDLTVDTDTLYVDSTNNRVGIGESSPSTALEVTGTVTADGLTVDGDTTLQGTTSTDATTAATAVSEAILRVKPHADTGNSLWFSLANSADPVLQAANFDGSGVNDLLLNPFGGNVGIGTDSPSSPNGFSTNLTISGSSCSLALDETDANTWEMIVSSGSLRFYDETNERMRIDSSGNVGIGGVPKEKLHVITADNGLGTVADASADELVLENTGATGMTFLSPNTAVQTIAFGDTDNRKAGWIEYDHATNNMAFGTVNSSSERMRIDSSGNLLVGTTASSYTQITPGLMEIVNTGDVGFIDIKSSSAEDFDVRLQSNSGAFYVHAGGSGSPNMVVDTSGNLLVGITSTGVNARVRARTAVTDATANAIYLDNSSGTLLQYIRADGLFSTGTATNSPYNFSTTGRDAYLNSSGQLGYLSSVRDSKLNIEGLDDISWLYQLNAVSFNYKVKDDNGEYTGEAEQGVEYGLIAEEVEQVNADLCFYDQDEEGNQTLAGVTYRKLIPVLTKAIQEQQAIIETLQAQVAELQGAN